MNKSKQRRQRKEAAHADRQMSRFLQMEQRRQSRAVVVDESTALKLTRIDPTLPFLHPRDKGVS